MGKSKRLEILLVEDNPGDIELTREALECAELLHDQPLHVARDGEEALAFLRREAPYRDAPRPDLILLDLNMPNKDGREVLAEIKQDLDLMDIPIVIFTGSHAEADVVQTYRLEAGRYLTKPADFDEFQKVVDALNDFWSAQSA